jgi:hypothetical protein
MTRTARQYSYAKFTHERMMHTLKIHFEMFMLMAGATPVQVLKPRSCTAV